MERFPLFLLLVLGIAIGCSEKDDTGSSSGTTDIPADADADADGYDATDDCDDGDATVHPGADEVAYDGVDNDCDPSTADDDLDGDGGVHETSGYSFLGFRHDRRRRGSTIADHK